MIRVLLIVVSAVLGIAFGLTLTSACSSEGSCSASLQPLPKGQVEVHTRALSGGADDSLRDITATAIVVGASTLDILYHRHGKPGLVTYRAKYKNVDGTFAIVDAGAPTAVDAGVGR